VTIFHSLLIFNCFGAVKLKNVCETNLLVCFFTFFFLQHFAQFGLEPGDGALMINGLMFQVDDLNPFQWVFCKVKETFDQVNESKYSVTLQYSHLFISVTIFWPEQKLSHPFCCLKKPSKKANPLIRSDFCGPLVIGLTEFHSTGDLQPRPLGFFLLVVVSKSLYSWLLHPIRSRVYCPGPAVPSSWPDMLSKLIITVIHTT